MTTLADAARAVLEAVAEDRLTPELQREYRRALADAGRARCTYRLAEEDRKKSAALAESVAKALDDEEGRDGK